MDDEKRMKAEQDEFLKAFDQIRLDLSGTKDDDDDILRSDDVAVSADNIFAEDSKPDTSDHTILMTKKSKVAGAGVIDKDEWDEMLKALDNKPIKPAEVNDDVVEAAAAVVGGRAARNAKKKYAKAKKQKAKKKKKNRGGIFKKILIAILVLGMLAAIACAAIVIKIIKETPEINPNNIYSMLTQSSVIYDINGNTVDVIYSGDALRTNVEYSEIPQQLIDAFVSIEDKTFWNHHGFNFIRMVGAVWQKVSGQSSRIGGTSTITQQLARNIYLTSTKSQRSLVRKIQEAYYTVIIERSLSKEQIIEAYLNTVYLGFNSNGISAASRAYFNKDISELTLIECAQLAALPQSPNTYAPLKRISASTTSVDLETLDIVDKSSSYITYYNDACESRIKLVLYYMHDQGKITDEEYETAKADSIRGYLNPGVNIGNAANESSYFTDYITSQVLSDLQTKLGYTYAEAYELLYEGGLVINSTLDMDVQVILEGVYDDPSNFPKVSLSSLNLDEKKNILNSEGTKVVLYAKSNMLDSDGNFILNKGEFKWNSDGSLTIYKGGRMNFYNTTANDVTDVRMDIKDMYEVEDEYLYSRSGSYLIIGAKYKTRDESGNVVISADFFTAEPNAITSTNNGGITISSEFISLASRIIQPQSAMVIIDNETGQVRAMMGGRGISGKLLYNRATATRQAGSSIKPLAIYSTALQRGYLNSQITDETDPNYGGTVFTAATLLDSIPANVNDDLWPSNFDGTYTGITTLRNAVERSLNACAVNLYLQLDPKEILSNLQGYGLTTLVTEGEATDENASSLALGGMINGVKPIEMASAYSTFANGGVHTEYTCYTTVTNRKGDVILSSNPQSTQVLNEDVATLMLDILNTTVTQGIAGGAKLESQPSAGKTGTTSETNDIWFCGLTPKYSAACWLGYDMNIPIGSDSSKATKVWSAVMEKVGALDEREEFDLDGNFVTVTVDKMTGELPDEYTPVMYNEETDEWEYLEYDWKGRVVSSLNTEKFIVGTEPDGVTVKEVTSGDAIVYVAEIVQEDENEGYEGYFEDPEYTEEYYEGEYTEEETHGARYEVAICAETGYLATPYCTHVVYKEVLERPGGKSWETLLAEYSLLADPEKFEEDGSYKYALEDPELVEDANGNLVEVAVDPEKKSTWRKVDKTTLLDLVWGCENDPPQYYCPYHNPDPYGDPENGIEPEYPISPFADFTAGYIEYEEEDPEGQGDIDIEEDSEWEEPVSEEETEEPTQEATEESTEEAI